MGNSLYFQSVDYDMQVLVGQNIPGGYFQVALWTPQIECHSSVSPCSPRGKQFWEYLDSFMLVLILTQTVQVAMNWSYFFACLQLLCIDGAGSLRLYIPCGLSAKSSHPGVDLAIIPLSHSKCLAGIQQYLRCIFQLSGGRSPLTQGWSQTLNLVIIIHCHSTL